MKVDLYVMWSLYMFIVTACLIDYIFIFVCYGLMTIQHDQVTIHQPIVPSNIPPPHWPHHPSCTSTLHLSVHASTCFCKYICTQWCRICLFISHSHHYELQMKFILSYLIHSCSLAWSHVRGGDSLAYHWHSGWVSTPLEPSLLGI